MAKIDKTKAEWKAQLTPEQYYVTREHGTERPRSSPLNGEKRDGAFTCVCCGEKLFTSDAKFESGTGWPSFIRPIGKGAVSRASTIHRCSCGGRKCAAPTATPTSATCSPMAPSRPACATA